VTVMVGMFERPDREPIIEVSDAGGGR
jgi:hypothetical protein